MKPLFDEVHRQLEEVKKKESALSVALENNPKWPGSFGVLSAVASPGEIGTFAELSESASQGGRPWMMCMRKNQKRFGPGAVPAAGAPTVFMPVSINATTYIHAYPVAAVLEKGISLKDFDAFCKTQDGKEFMDSKQVFVRAPVHSAVFVPAGWVARLLYTDMSAAPRKPKLEVGSVVVYTMFCDKLFENTAATSKRALVTWNCDHFKTKKESDMWIGRRRVFEATFSLTV